eukprot:Gb_10521 [translate_table: standard]
MDKSMLGDLGSMAEEDQQRMSNMIDQLQIRDSFPAERSYAVLPKCGNASSSSEGSAFENVLFVGFKNALRRVLVASMYEMLKQITFMRLPSFLISSKVSSLCMYRVVLALGSLLCSCLMDFTGIDLVTTGLQMHWLVIKPNAFREQLTQLECVIFDLYTASEFAYALQTDLSSV